MSMISEIPKTPTAYIAHDRRCPGFRVRAKIFRREKIVKEFCTSCKALVNTLEEPKPKRLKVVEDYIQ